MNRVLWEHCVGLKWGAMKTVLKILFILCASIGIFASESFAEVYKYMDREGNTHYVDDPSKIPEDYRDQFAHPHKLPNIVREGKKRIVTRDFQDNPSKKSEAVKAFDQMLAQVTLPAPQPNGSTGENKAIELAQEGNSGQVTEVNPMSPPNVDLMPNSNSPRTGEMPPLVQKILSGPFLIFILGLLLLYIVSGWILLSRADMPGFGILVPIYNLVLLSRLGGFSGWWTLWALVPVVGAPIWGFSVNYGIAKQFDRSTGFAIITAIFPMVCLPIIAFSRSE